jgi:hypothetical protein
MMPQDMHDMAHSGNDVVRQNRLARQVTHRVKRTVAVICRLNGDVHFRTCTARLRWFGSELVFRRILAWKCYSRPQSKADFEILRFQMALTAWDRISK